MYGLAIARQLAAVHYGLGDAARAYDYLGAFEPSLGTLAPGVLSVGHAVEEAVREGAREFHFLRGREPYKYGWGAVDRPSWVRALARSSGATAALVASGPLHAAPVLTFRGVDEAAHRPSQRRDVFTDRGPATATAHRRASFARGTRRNDQDGGLSNGRAEGCLSLQEPRGGQPCPRRLDGRASGGDGRTTTGR